MYQNSLQKGSCVGDLGWWLDEFWVWGSTLDKRMVLWEKKLVKQFWDDVGKVNLRKKQNDQWYWVASAYKCMQHSCRSSAVFLITMAILCSTLSFALGLEGCLEHNSNKVSPKKERNYFARR